MSKQQPVFDKVESDFIYMTSTGLYQESEYELLRKMLSDNLNLINRHPVSNKDRKWFDRFVATQKMMTNRLNRENPTPLPGDVLYVECLNGRVHENALIVDTRTENGKTFFTVVPHGGCLIVDITQPHDVALKMVSSGGPYIGGVTHEHFASDKDVGTHNFWIWADRPCAHSAIWLINQPVLRWRLKEIHPNFY